MKNRLLPLGLPLALTLFFSVMAPSYGEMTSQDRADAAVADILFEYDGAEEFASYKVREDGFVDITFARSIPDSLYSELLEQLQNNADISGVLAGRGGRACRMW